MDKVILVGDIGSTKSSWWLSGKEPKEINLPGFNPIVHELETGVNLVASLKNELKENFPHSIWYYGTGIIDDQSKQIVKGLFKKEFPGSKLIIHSDLVGAAIATCGRDAGTVAILGTGSHAAVFDGQKIIRQANSLGYILGDEGGGSDIGKSLIQSYFYNIMPQSVRLEMDKLLPKGRPGFLNDLFSSPYPNQFLATFAQLAVSMKDDAWIRELISSRFRLFLKYHLVPLVPVEPVHFLGSIGCIFADLIENELNVYSLKAGMFLQNPSARLFAMHLNHGFE